MKRISESTSILVITNIRTVIDLFLGPFLAAFFISSSIEALPRYIIQYLALYLGCMVLVPVVSKIASGKLIHIILSIGITMELCILFWIVIAKESIIECVFLFGFIRGIEEQFYWFPFNTLRIDRIKDEDRFHFESVLVVTGKIVNITFPIILGGLIDTTNFARTAVIVFILSVAQVLVSFVLKKPEYTKPFNLRNGIRMFPKKPKAVRMAAAELFAGSFESIPAAVFPALIYMNNPTNLGLGVISSLSAAAFIVVKIIYGRISFRRVQKNPECASSDNRKMLAVCAALCIISALAYAIHSCLATVIIAYAVYTVCYGLATINITAKRLNFQHDPECLDMGKNEFWAIREIAIDLGRMASFTLFLLIVTKCPDMLPAFLVVMISMMVPYIWIHSKVHTIGD